MNTNQLPTQRATRATILAVGTALAAALFMGCGGGEPHRTEMTSSTAVSTQVDATAVATDAVASSATATTSAPAVVENTAPSSTDGLPVTTAPAVDIGPMRAVPEITDLVVLDAPDGAPVAIVAPTTAFGTPSVLGVTGPPSDDGWVPVLVNTRPNGLSGFVRTEDVRIEPVSAEVFVDLAARTLRLVEGGAETGVWPIAVGAPDRPTPTGRFFITDKLATGDPDSVWGEFAFGLSAYSDVLTDFIGGVGQVGLHGTNNPDSIGQASSSGCIRLPNDAIAGLIDRLPLGTPVHIV